MSFESFSRRFLTHPGLVTHPTVVTPPGPDMNQLYAAAVNNQLLVDVSATKGVQAALNAKGIKWRVLASLLDEIGPSNKDVQIYGLKLPLPAGLDIFSLTDDLRGKVGDLKTTGPKKVSPNHVLIPAPSGWGCPHGPPSQTSASAATARPVPFAPAAGEIQQVTVIDSGYQWNPAWGQNPLGQPFTQGEAEQLPAFANAPQPPQKGKWQAGTPDVSAAQWATAPPNVSPETVPGTNEPPYVLGALAGHANFVAGVIAQNCANAQISIRNHNGSYIEAAKVELPTEASVARSICKSIGASVINVGFAFPAYKNQVSIIWQRTAEHIGSSTVVVAPAGNQDSGPPAGPPRYPGALNYRYPGLFPNWIEVGSYHHLSPIRFAKSSFSNFGPWVTCAAVGENVVSTFLKVSQQLEDEGTPAGRATVDFTGNSLALWNGTSFAAPKVAAAIAAQVVAAGDPISALSAVLGTGTDQPQLQIGRILPF